MVGTLAFVVDSARAGGIDAQPKMGDPLVGLTAGQLDQFFTGKASFSRDELFKKFEKVQGDAQLRQALQDTGCLPYFPGGESA